MTTGRTPCAGLSRIPDGRSVWTSTTGPGCGWLRRRSPRCPPGRRRDRLTTPTTPVETHSRPGCTSTITTEPTAHRRTTADQQAEQSAWASHLVDGSRPTSGVSPGPCGAPDPDGQDLDHEPGREVARCAPRSHAESGTATAGVVIALVGVQLARPPPRTSRPSCTFTDAGVGVQQRGQHATSENVTSWPSRNCYM